MKLACKLLHIIGTINHHSGGEKNNGTAISLTGFCGKGYEGVACGVCSSGYAKFGGKIFSIVSSNIDE